MEDGGGEDSSKPCASDKDADENKSSDDEIVAAKGGKKKSSAKAAAVKTEQAKAPPAAKDEKPAAGKGAKKGAAGKKGGVAAPDEGNIDKILAELDSKKSAPPAAAPTEVDTGAEMKLAGGKSAAEKQKEKRAMQKEGAKQEEDNPEANAEREKDDVTVGAAKTEHQEGTDDEETIKKGKDDKEKESKGKPVSKQVVLIKEAVQGEEKRRLAAEEEERKRREAEDALLEKIRKEEERKKKKREKEKERIQRQKEAGTFRTAEQKAKEQRAKEMVQQVIQRGGVVAGLAGAEPVAKERPKYVDKAKLRRKQQQGAGKAEGDEAEMGSLSSATEAVAPPASAADSKVSSPVRDEKELAEDVIESWDLLADQSPPKASKGFVKVVSVVRQGGLLPEPKSALLPDPKVALLPDPETPQMNFAATNNRVYVNVISADRTTFAEVSTLNDGFLLLSTVKIKFPGAAGLEYINPRTGVNRIIGPESGRLPPPPEGWGNTQYTACVPVAANVNLVSLLLRELFDDSDCSDATPSSANSLRKKLKSETLAYYGITETNRNISCLLLGKELPVCNVLCSHIFPKRRRRLSYELIGLPSVDVPKNCLLLHRAFEHAFDRGRLSLFFNRDGDVECLILDPRLCQENLYNYCITKVRECKKEGTAERDALDLNADFLTSKKFMEFNGAILSFRNANRPYRRSLYWHAYKSRVRAVRKNWMTKSQWKLDDILSPDSTSRARIENWIRTAYPDRSDLESDGCPRRLLFVEDDNSGECCGDEASTSRTEDEAEATESLLTEALPGDAASTSTAEENEAAGKLPNETLPIEHLEAAEQVPANETKEQAKARIMARIKKRVVDAKAAGSIANLRSPVICVLGHVDVGKANILDKIRRTNVQEGEAGGITQQIGATRVPADAVREQAKMVNDFKGDDVIIPGLLIIDTPGHESFSNLCSRSSSLCDFAILVVDIMRDIEPHTLESIKLLTSKKTLFIIALDNVDHLYDWTQNPRKDIRDVLKAQQPHTDVEFKHLVQVVVGQFAEQGLKVALFSHNAEADPYEYYWMVPVSAHTGDGIGNLMACLVQYVQKFQAKRLRFSAALQCTVLEVKALPGLGTTIDVILVNGRLRVGDTIVVPGVEGPIVTHIRELLMPQPLKEMRVKNPYEHHQELCGAQGIKILAKDLDKALPGLQLLVAHQEDEIEFCKEEVAEALKRAFQSISLADTGAISTTKIF